ncbi:hypothetical protein GJ688_11805 [Heliobacillus mobilis]|uniref:Uncharacterized protein n=1 Tax=Heliobacterium mobile TaxID=28064 RepID=A0A6I3SL63_HELMO|nr:radical SAM protein [Heliobacterium mobile]MTV49659.1 hypothetical protein [Heliobacterium mobile]
MRYLLYGSQGFAEHVVDALTEKNEQFASLTDRSQITAIVDHELSQLGRQVREFTVQEATPRLLRDIPFDKVIIATLDYPKAIEQLQHSGCTMDKIETNLFWEPFFLQMEPTTYCNYSCGSCSRSMLPPGRANHHLNMEDFYSVMGQFPRVKRVQLQGLGEPLLNPSLSRMVKYLRERNINTSITTNGSIKIQREMLDHLDKLIFSIDSTEPERFQQLRPGGNWTKIRAHIAEAWAYRQKQSERPLRLVYNFVVSAGNHDDMDGLCYFATQLPPDEVHIHLAENWLISSQEGYKNSRFFAEAAFAIEEQVIDKVETLRSLLGQIGVTVTYTGGQRRKEACWWPFAGIFISCDGYVTPCCIRMHPEVFHLGNGLSGDFRQIWFGEKYQSFRQGMVSSSENGICDDCPR